MQTLIFEVQARPGHEDHYFNRAATLKPLLKSHTGMLFLERFRSLEDPQKILSFQRWKDEAAISKWRSDRKHFGAQAAGRNKHFEDYRIRVAQVLKRQEKGQSAVEWRREGFYDENALDKLRLITLSFTKNSALDEGQSTFQAILEPSRFLTLNEVASIEHGYEALDEVAQHDELIETMFCVVSRDYTMFCREEAPQYMEPVKSL